jgi:hypothetical protein
MSEERIMTAEEFFGGIESDRGRGSMSSPRRRRGRAKNTFADIKARMVMRIYGVTREKAEKIISERAASAGTESGVNSAGAARVRERFLDPDDLLAD